MGATCQDCVLSLALHISVQQFIAQRRVNRRGTAGSSLEHRGMILWVVSRVPRGDTGCYV
jgi:hypothetical protein